MISGLVLKYLNFLCVVIQQNHGSTACSSSLSDNTKRPLHPTQVSTWKRQAIEGMAGVFSDKVKKAENKDGEIKDLHAKIGQLAVENGTVAYAAPLGPRSP